MENKYFYCSIDDTKKYGIISAAILGRIKFWCDYNRDNKTKDRFYEGYWWSGYMSIKELVNQTGLSYKTIQKNIYKLVDDGIIVKGRFNKKAYDKTCWYRLNPTPPTEVNHTSLRGVVHLPEGHTTPLRGEMDHLPEGQPIPVNLSVIPNDNPNDIPPYNPLLTIDEQILKLNLLIEENKFNNADERGDAYVERNKLLELKKLEDKKIKTGAK